MLTNSADLESAELGWGLRSLARGVAKVGKGVVKKTVVAPTKLAYKSAKVATKYTVVEPTKFAAKTTLKATKAITNLALRPVRSRLGTLKDRRARLLSYQRRRSLAPTVAEKAQARKDVKSMLASKGPHGKMLAWLAGPTFAGELGVVGYDDAALAAIATALTASLVKIMADAAKSKFAPADAAKAGVAAGLTTAATKLSPAAEAALAPAAAAAEKARAATRAVEESAAAAEEAAEPVTQEEVAAEPTVEAEEAATDQETSNVEGVLDGLGWLDGFRGVAEEAAAPAAMSESTARQIGSAAQRIVCSMSAPALNAIGGVQAVKVAGSLCAAVSVGDDATVRRTLPAALQIAAQATNAFAADAYRLGVERGGGLPSAGFGAAVSLTAMKRRRGKKGKRYLEMMGVTADELGMVAAFAGADPGDLSFGLAGVTADDLQASTAAATGSSAVLLVPGLALAIGLWAALR